MMWSEFLELTGFTEKYMTFTDYAKIEKVYMESDIDKRNFCKRFYLEHNKKVNNVVDMLIRAKTIEQKESYITTGSGFEDIESTNLTLKNAFIATFKI